MAKFLKKKWSVTLTILGGYSLLLPFCYPFDFFREKKETPDLFDLPGQGFNFTF